MSGRASDDETLDRLLPGVRSAALEMNTMMRITVATDGENVTLVARRTLVSPTEARLMQAKVLRRVR